MQPPPAPILVVESAPSLLDYLTAGGTIAAAAAGVVAAGAAWRTANAAKRAADNSADTARRALEALSRALLTEKLQVSVWRGDIEPDDYSTPEKWPGPLRVQVRNVGSFTAGDVRATITDTRGKTWPSLGPATLPADAPQVWHLPDFEPGCPPADPAAPVPETGTYGTARHRLLLTFTDARGLMRWQQSYELLEETNLGPNGPERPVPSRRFTAPPIGLPEPLDQ